MSRRRPPDPLRELHHAAIIIAANLILLAFALRAAYRERRLLVEGLAGSIAAYDELYQGYGELYAELPAPRVLTDEDQAVARAQLAADVEAIKEPYRLVDARLWTAESIDVPFARVTSTPETGSLAPGVDWHHRYTAEHLERECDCDERDLPPHPDEVNGPLQPSEYDELMEAHRHGPGYTSGGDA